ncbi:MAG: hypothetical protein WC749_03345 [Dehalococcoidia bacterium]
MPRFRQARNGAGIPVYSELEYAIGALGAICKYSATRASLCQEQID